MPGRWPSSGCERARSNRAGTRSTLSIRRFEGWKEITSISSMPSSEVRRFRKTPCRDPGLSRYTKAMPSTLLAAIISKPQKPELAGILRELIAWLESHGYSYVLDPDSAAYVEGANPVPRQDLPEHHPNLVIVLGG